MKLNNIYRLKHIIRYANVQRVSNENVAEHSFFVSANILELAKDYNFDVGKAVLMSTVHDMPEIYLDDISHAIKSEFPTIAKAHKDAEEVVIKKFSPLVQELFAEYEKQDTVEALIVKLADIYQCIQYANHEISLGNGGYMKEVLEGSTKLVKIQKEKISKNYPESIKGLSDD